MKADTSERGLEISLRQETQRRLGIRITEPDTPVASFGARALESMPRDKGVEVIPTRRDLRLELVGPPPPGLPIRGLEAIVERFGYPSLLVQQDTFDIPIADTWRALLEVHRLKLERIVRSVGRVELENHEREWLGTAWMVAPNIAVTNRHVAVHFAVTTDQGWEVGRNPFGVPYGVFINFAAEYLQPTVRRVQVKRVLYVAPQTQEAPDIALLEVEPGADVPPPLPLFVGTPTRSRFIAAVGYPAYDPERNSPTDMARIFDNVYGVKRLAPGEIKLVQGQSFTHNATTLGGSSGSPIVDLESGCVIGLHYAGEYLKANLALSSESIAQTLQLVKPGLAPTAPPRPGPSLDAPPEETPTNLEARKGYDPEFLGKGALAVPLPDVTGVQSLLAPLLADPSKHVLNYTHYSVAMNRVRRLAFFTASNIDGETAQAIKRKGKEQWYFDPRIAREHQAGGDLYTNNQLDRGHLTRRLDPAWGDKTMAMAGERDTFFWTNCSPQHATFNQRIWLELEDYILENAVNEGFKAILFTGPLFRDSDPEYRGILLPRAFWKVAVMVTTGKKLSATAYIVSQANLLTQLEFTYGQFRTYQVPVSKVAQLTRLGFGPLAAHDPLGAGPGGGNIREVASAGDILL
ncbi:DNA/RNA non-specific endonuclease [Myxococcus stipitatus]|uniref:DNA/RNA non-specific endonuclease n=1 Tax=Myxococcus stipitatus TaxID=83455 RepID=UPI001F1E36DB|nr:DNA/RNA non-specific endonuclease [Myxococcus stipitatus]MCE9672164.1 DNA/RNA non-specific endonuclease [Myxococcus stipitatus]